MRRYIGCGSLGSAFLLPVQALMQIPQKYLHIRPPIDEFPYTRITTPLLKRPLVSEPGTRSFESHFPFFYQVERLCVRKEDGRGFSGMVDPLLNKGSRL